MAINRVVLLGLGGMIVIGAGAYFILQQHKSVLAPHVPAAVTAPQASGAPQAPTVAAPPADCLFPGPPPVPPDGYTASASDMVLGRTAIQAFVVRLEAYQACRNSQIDHAEGETEQQKKTWLAEGNAAVDEANALAGAFSVELKKFKARQAKH